MSGTAIGYLLVIIGLCVGSFCLVFLIGYFFPQLTMKKCLSWFGAGLRITTKALKVILEKQPMENFLAKNWRTLLLIVGVLFAIFVWPTLYRPLPKQGSILMRENRITGAIQKYRPDGYLGEWY